MCVIKKGLEDYTYMYSMDQVIFTQHTHSHDHTHTRTLKFCRWRAVWSGYILRM